MTASPTILASTISAADSTAYAGVYTFNDKKVTGTYEQKAGNEILTMVPFSKDEDVTEDFNLKTGADS